MSEIFTARAPGRVNLIGEHTDYNGGMVLPAALSIGIEATLSPRTDGTVAVTSTHYDDPAVRDLADDAVGEWADPVVGALREANVLGLLHCGASVDISSQIPEGSGLSSSAALIVAVLKAARKAGGTDLSDVQIAIAARRVENDYMDVPCGIMDQMAVALAAPGSAMALDTKEMEWDVIALPAGYDFAVVHSGVSRKLTDGRYAERKEECDAAKRHFGTVDLCLLDRGSVENAGLAEIPKRRALHCVTEQQRAVQARDALVAGDMTGFGALMNASHASMRDLFEVSLPEIDALVETAQDLGALGARLTGGGFGGCIVAAVESTAREAWLEQLLDRHPEARFIDAASG